MNWVCSLKKNISSLCFYYMQRMNIETQNQAKPVYVFLFNVLFLTGGSFIKTKNKKSLFLLYFVKILSLSNALKLIFIAVNFYI